jgi:PAS domain-containing protein
MEDPVYFLGIFAVICVVVVLMMSLLFNVIGAYRMFGVRRKEIVEKEPHDFLQLKELTQKLAMVENERNFSVRLYSERYDNLVSLIPGVVYRLDIEGHFEWISDQIELFGWHPPKLIGEHFSRILHPADVEKVSRYLVLPHYLGKITGEEGSPKLFDERRTAKRGTRDLLVRIITPTWSEGASLKQAVVASYGEISASGLFDAPTRTDMKQFVGTIGVIQDMTELINLRQQIKATAK